MPFHDAKWNLSMKWNVTRVEVKRNEMNEVDDKWNAWEECNEKDEWIWMAYKWMEWNVTEWNGWMHKRNLLRVPNPICQLLKKFVFQLSFNHAILLYGLIQYGLSQFSPLCRTDLCDNWEGALQSFVDKKIWSHMGTSEGFDYLPAPRSERSPYRGFKSSAPTTFVYLRSLFMITSMTCTFFALHIVSRRPTNYQPKSHPSV